ncbi:MAG: 3-mercaptopyruvate sulfurtransferase [Pseudomonadota bacterium]
MGNDPLITADWLLEHLKDPHVHVLDATWVPPFLKDRPTGAALYKAGHIPGAQYFDIDAIADKASGLSHMLPSAAEFGEAMGRLGIDNEAHIIVYDDNSFFASARAWWMFRTMGHDNVQVLDGGLQAWRVAGGAITSDVATPAPKRFEAELNPALMRDQNSMREHVEAQDAKILDARDTGRFNGTAPEPRAGLPSGHMPGSFCVPAGSLLTPEKTLKPAEDLQPILSDFLSTNVVTSCGSGVSAAVISLALARLGKFDAALYDGSWSEWAANSDNPIATLL